MIALRHSFLAILAVASLAACSAPTDSRDSSRSSGNKDGGVPTTVKPSCKSADAGTTSDGGVEGGDDSSDAGPLCTCPDGYRLEETLCHLIDLCAEANGGCAPNATCTPGINARTCTCKEGYEGNGVNCTSTALKCPTCAVAATCELVDGEPKCVCMEGYLGDGLTCKAPCKGDADCSGGEKCCVAKGTCHPVAGDVGDECDCEHPCPGALGCYPGTCGATPMRCRASCYPGDANVVADACSSTFGVENFCRSLPTALRTPENKGGACVQSDSCNVISQDCPNLPLDRTKPAGANNPAVQHTCVPVSPTSTACYPAGTKTLGQKSCEYDTCGDSSSACVKGLLCTGILDNEGAGTACNKQCSNPSDTPTSSPQCASGEVCVALYGPGRVKVKTGVCMAQ